MDATQGLLQELGVKEMVHASGTGTDLGSEIDVQDWKLGEVSFLFLVEETGTTDPSDVSITINDGDTGVTGNNLKTFDLDQVAAGGKELYTGKVKEFDQYMKVQDISDAGAGTASVTVIALGGKRES